MNVRRTTACALAAGAIAVGLPGTSSAAAAQPNVAVVGDSYAAGWTGTSRNLTDAWEYQTAGDLGWRVDRVVADPGGGFVHRGDEGTLQNTLRLHPISSYTDWVLLQGGLNDSNENPDLVWRGVAEAISVIHQQAPDAQVIVVGMFFPRGQVNSSNRLEVAREIADYRAIGQTRYTIAAMCGFDVGPDGTHPTYWGQKQIGDWVAWHIVNGLDVGEKLTVGADGVAR